MTARDRIVVLVIGAIVVLAVAWLGIVSPERKHASKLLSEVHSAQASLSTAESQLAEAKAAQRRYTAAYASIVNLGEAVPADEQVPSLIYEVNHAAGKAHVGFQTISASGGEAAAASTGVAGAETAGFAQLPFSFTFTGTYKQLYSMMSKLQQFAISGVSKGRVQVSGRLLTIDSLSLAGGSSASGPPAGATGGAAAGGGQLTGTVSATAYVLPPGEALTAGATPAAPAGTASAAGETSSSSAPAPAVVEAPR